jgi:Chaperone of endosialidase
MGYGVADTTLTSGSNNVLLGTDTTSDTYSATTSNAIAMGQSNKPGTGDIAIGYQALKTNAGDNLQNVAIGYQSMSSASMTTAASQNTAVGNAALSMLTTGALNTAVGYGALGNVTTGGQNTAVGRSALTADSTGAQNVAVGYNAQQYENGSFNVGVGYGSIAGGYNGAFATGSGNSALGNGTLFNLLGGNNNTVMGYQVANVTLNTGSNNILIGTNSAVDTPLPGTSNFLNIGNLIYGTSIGTAASPGFVGIGTATPSQMLTIGTGNILLPTAPNNGSGNLFFVSDTSQPGTYGMREFYTGGNGYIDVAATSSGGGLVIRADSTGGANTERVRITACGNVGIGTTTPLQLLHVGSAAASGVVAEFQNSSAACTLQPGSSSMTTTCSSDIRLKTNIRDTNEALPSLTDMRVRDFTVRATGENRTGVVAQELLTTHPEMVHMTANGFYAVDAPNPWKLVKAVQELKAANDNQAAEIRKLRERLDALESAQARR